MLLLQRQLKLLLYEIESQLLLQQLLLLTLMLVLIVTMLPPNSSSKLAYVFDSGQVSSSCTMM